MGCPQLLSPPISTTAHQPHHLQYSLPLLLVHHSGSLTRPSSTTVFPHLYLLFRLLSPSPSRASHHYNLHLNHGPHHCYLFLLSLFDNHPISSTIVHSPSLSSPPPLPNFSRLPDHYNSLPLTFSHITGITLLYHYSLSYPD